MRSKRLKIIGLWCASLGLAVLSARSVCAVLGYQRLGQVLGDSTLLAQAPTTGTSFLPTNSTSGSAILSPLFQVNIPAVFADAVTLASLVVEEQSVFNGQARFVDEVVLENGAQLLGNLNAEGIDIDVGTGEVTASNLVYSVIAGGGIEVSGDQDLTITNTDRGSAQKIFGKIKVGSDTAEAGSNTDTFEFSAGSGIALSLNTSDKKLTLSADNLSGWYKANSSTVALITSTNNVGIGTTTANTKLEVDSGTSGESGISLTRMTSSSTAGIGGGKVLSVDSGGRIILVQDQTGDSATPSAEAILPTATNGMTLYFNGTNWAASNNLYHDGGSIGISTTSPVSRFHVFTNLATKIGQIIQGYAGQTANLTEWRDSSGSVLSYIDANGVFNGSANVAGSLNPGLTNGSVLFQGASGITQDNANFFWDDTNNRLGLGTTSPGAALHVISRTTSTAAAIFSGGADVDAHANAGQIYLGSDSTARGKIGYNWSNADLYIDNTYNAATADIHFRSRTAGTAVNIMTLTGGGLVGIGTTAPLELLHVTSSGGDSAYFEGDVKIGLDGASAGGNPVAYLQITSNWGDDVKPAIHFGSGSYGWNQYYSSGGNLVLNRENSSVENNVLTMLRSNGYVGIGTTAPTSELYVQGDQTPDSPALEIGNAQYGYRPQLKINFSTYDYPSDFYATFSHNGNAGGVQSLGGLQLVSQRATGNTPSSNIVFAQKDGTNAATAMMIIAGNTGYVGIGTTSPGAPLDVSGLIQSNSEIWAASGNTRLTSTGVTRIGGANYFLKNNGGLQLGTPSGLGTSLIFVTENAQRAFITSTGLFGIGTSSPTALLHVNGGYGANDAFTVNQTLGGNILSASASGVTKFVIGNNGHIGLGTTAPVGAKLHIYDMTGNVNIGLQVNNAAASGTLYGTRITSTATSAINAFGDYIDVSGTVSNILYGSAINASGTATNGIRILSLAGPSAAANNYTIYSSSTAKSYLAGSLGIGTTTPATPLHVYSAADDNLAIATFEKTPSGGGNAGIRLHLGNWNDNNDTTRYSFRLTNGNTLASPTAETFRIGYDGTIYSSMLTANTATIDNGITVNMSSTGTPAAGFGNAISFVGSSDTTASRNMGRLRTYWETATDASRKSKLTLSTYNGTTENDALTIDGSGNVGIGTTAPSKKLTVEDSSAGSTDTLVLQNSTTGLNKSTALAFNTNSVFAGGFITTSRIRGISEDNSGWGYGALAFETTPGSSGTALERMRITSSGNVGIGTTTIGTNGRLAIKGSGTGTALIGQYNFDSSYAAISLNGSLAANGDYNFLSSSTDRTLYINRPSGAGIVVSENDSGIRQMIISSGGRVGIGNISPTALLHINGGYGANDAFTVNQTLGGNILSASASGSTKFVISNGGNVGINRPIPLGKLDIQNTDNSSALRFSRGDDNAFDFTYYATTGRLDLDYRLSTSRTLHKNMMSWDAVTGNIAIGTTSPREKLDVYTGNVRLDTTYAIKWDTTASRNELGFDASSGLNAFAQGNIVFTFDSDNNQTDRVFAINSNSTSGQLLTVLESGYVGIGTTSPGAKTHIVGSDGAVALPSLGTALDFLISNNADTQIGLITPTNGIAGITFGDSDNQGQGYIRYSNADDSMRFWTAGAEKLTILSGGNVGIGTTNPGASLDIYTSSTSRQMLSSSTFDLISSNSSATPFEINHLGGAALIADIQDGSSSVFAISDGGNVGIGTTTFGTSAAKVFAIAGSTAPTTSITDGVQLFAVDVAGSHELQVRDEAGNVTTLSPHNFSLLDNQRSEDLAWAFYSERNGLAINADMTKALRVVEKLSGEQLIRIKNLTNGEDLTNFYADQSTQELALDNAEWVTRAELNPFLTWGNDVLTIIGKTIFEKPAEFLADITVKGRLYLSGKDVAGQIIILPGDTQATVTFQEPFKVAPIITLTTQNSFVNVTLKEVSTTGFTIAIKEAQADQLTVLWSGVAATELPTTTSTSVAAPIPSPALTNPSPTAEPSSVPSPSVTPEPTVAGSSTESAQPATSSALVQ